MQPVYQIGNIPTGLADQLDMNLTSSILYDSNTYK